MEDKYNDIAMVKTKNRIIFSESVRPICLPFKYTDKDFEGNKVTVLGSNNDRIYLFKNYDVLALFFFQVGARRNFQVHHQTHCKQQI